MKIFKGKGRNVFGIVLGLSVFAAAMVLVHGCGIDSYEAKKLVSLSIDPVNNTATAGTVSIAKNTVQQFKVTGHYSDATSIDMTSSVTWDTSDSGVATVSAGLATAVAASGTCTITASGQGMTASITLAINDVTIQSIAVSPASATMNMGFAQQFTATGTFSDSSQQDISSVVTWNSSAPSVATINSQGLATAVSAGTTNITAQWTVTSPAATITVSSLALSSIAITKAGNPQVSLPPVQLTATGTFVDSSTANLTTTVTWSSDDTAVATVDSAGLLTPVKAGVVVIRARVNGAGVGGVDVEGTLQVLVLAQPGH